MSRLKSNFLIKAVLFICSILPAGNLLSQEENHGLVNWLSFKEAQEKNKIVERPFLIDIYTDWCGWCKHMMRTTYSNPGIASYINTHFYPVKFDAEGKDTITYNGKVYKPTSAAPKTPHELALQFLGSNLSYPSTIFVTNNFQYSLLSQGYVEEKKFEPLLIFFVENVWRTASYDQFNKHFTNTFYDTLYPKGNLKHYQIEDLEKLQKKKRKKAAVFINTGFCNSGKVMSKTTFSDSALVNTLNRYYYFVDFDATRADTIVFKNEKFSQTLLNNFPIHSLTLRISNNNFTLPLLCILDEELNTIQVLNFYQSPENLNPVLRYFGSDAFKKMNYTDYLNAEQKKNKKP